MGKRFITTLLAVCLLLLTACAPQESEALSSASAHPNSAAVPVKKMKYVEFFAEDRVHDLYVEISDEDWEAVKTNPSAKEYHSVDVTIDGATIYSVGFRTRGNSSLWMRRYRGSDRYPFRLKFDKYVDKQRFQGLDEMVLTNGIDDPSYLREYVGYEAFRALGMNVPLVTLFNLYINGELHGVYIGVEAIDNRFLTRAFGSHSGNLYEAGLRATLTPEMDLEVMEQKKGADESKSDLAALIRVLDEMPLGEKGEIESMLDVDSALKYMAGCAVLHNWDDYAGQFAHNFYFYNDGLLHMIPWDMNECCLQTQAMYRPSDGARQDIATPITDGSSLEARPLVQKLLAVPEYYERYLTYCETLADWLETLPDTLSALHNRIADAVKNDPSALFSYDEFEAQFDAENSDGLAGFIRERAEYLRERLPELAAD